MPVLPIAYNTFFSLFLFFDYFYTPAGDNRTMPRRVLRSSSMQIQGRGGSSQYGPKLGCSIPRGNRPPNKSGW